MSERSAQLRAYLGNGRTHMVVSAYDGLTALLADRAGFPILHVTGFGVSAGHGYPDIGLLTMTEMVDACRQVCDVTSKPVIADADTGHGNELNVHRTVRAFEDAGAAGLHIEDQVAPKRCGHMLGKSVIPAAEMAAKVAAAADARRDSEFVLIARTDALGIEGVDGAIERARAYRDAGADMLFVEAPRDEAEIELIARELAPTPLVFNWSFDGVTPDIPLVRVEELGYSVVLFTDVASVVHRAVSGFYDRLLEARDFADVAEMITPFADFNAFLGLDEWREREARYAGPS
jgi:2-methylisocitrate lyase-like PEP mutase family enzyme